MKSRREIEIEVAQASAEREQARIALSALAADRRPGRSDLIAEQGQANAERLKRKTDRRKADVPLPEGMEDRRRGYRRRADVVRATREKAIEYGLIAALIAIVIAAAVILVGNDLSIVFNKVANCLTSPSAATCS